MPTVRQTLLQRIISGLGRQERLLVCLIFSDGLTLSEAAEVLSLNAAHAELLYLRVLTRVRAEEARSFPEVTTAERLDMPQSIRSKFKFVEIRQRCETPHVRTYVFETQYDPLIPEDRRFLKATPQGTITMQVDQPQVLERFHLGECYYFDAIEAPPAAG